MPDKTSNRLRSLDAVRGAAVVLMVLWHTTDGWLAEAHRTGPVWDAARVAGGLAAPLFLATAGAAVGVRLRRGDRLAEIVRRGASIVVLGWLLRLQIWLVDAGALLRPRTWAAALAGVTGCGLALWALRATGHRARPASGGARAHARVALLALALLALAVWRLHADARDRAPLVLRVDVLSCIGASIVLSACVAKLGGWRALAIGAGLVLAIARPLREVGALADAPALTAWVARSLDDTNRAFAAFPVVPWCAYAMAGCAVVLAPLRKRSASFAFVLGLALAALCFEGGTPWVRRLLHDTPALRPAARFSFYGGLSLTLAALATLPATRPLDALGRASLPIYWIHLELAFGLAAIPLRRRLDPITCLAASVALVVATGWAARRWSTRGRAWNRHRAEGGSGAHTFWRQIVSSPNPRA